MEKEKEHLIRLMNDYGDYLKKTAFYMIQDLHIAEDLTQETFISYYKNQQFQGKSSEKTYLYRILLNHIKMYFRKNKVLITHLDDYETSENIIIEDIAINKLDIARAMNSMDRKYKTVIVLYYYNDLSVEEISKILSIGNSTVKMRLKRARDRIKLRLGGSYENIC